MAAGIAAGDRGDVARPLRARKTDLAGGAHGSASAASGTSGSGLQRGPLGREGRSGARAG